ncbi:MAG: hypothetical protein ACI9CA_000541, partial [Natronomonas sp.]
MQLNRKHVAGIAAVTVATVYSLSRWRGPAHGPGEQTSAVEYPNP